MSSSAVQIPAVLDRIGRANREHDVDALTAAFTDDVDSRQAAHSLAEAIVELTATTGSQQ